MLAAKSFGKINITLEVIGRFPDGYHQIVSVMQAIELCDTLSFKLSFNQHINFICDMPVIQTDDNLVLKAARLLKEYSEHPYGADIHLEKIIPVSSGLGGGSSNAAVTLLSLNQLWDLNLNQDTLTMLAKKIGSDVAFFLNGPSCIAEQKGDTITQIKSVQPTNMVLVVPKIDLQEKTKNMYNLISMKDYTDGKLSFKTAKLIESGQLPTHYPMYNIFKKVAMESFTEISLAEKAMIESGASQVQLSGSGPSLFTFTKSTNESKRISEKLAALGYNPIISKTLHKIDRYLTKNTHT
ncbi:MAG: 4-(cytidine 5'-diphospho)-2-C-methyl-D-erythritol kinase [Dehalococcoidia bacterium]|nr:4-(cytidine 5'-diphospho)-2-C-methyl-D-erythritol kinase [Dehalococcoidia bacterium]